MSKERPILFQWAMVRAILDGSKTQTRRIMKPQPEPVPDQPGEFWWPCHTFQSMVKVSDVQAPGAEGMAGDACPYGREGDRLWVRETWGVISNAWDDDGNLVDWVPDRPARDIHEMPFGQGYYSGHAIYAADGAHEWAGDDDGGGEPRSAWHPSIHMPRAASRILLEIVSVRVERLNDCSDEDAQAEGCSCYVCGKPMDGRSEHDCHCFHRKATASDYRNLWESINGAGSWDANPFVWVVEFKRISA